MGMHEWMQGCFFKLKILNSKEEKSMGSRDEEAGESGRAPCTQITQVPGVHIAGPLSTPSPPPPQSCCLQRLGFSHCVR